MGRAIAAERGVEVDTPLETPIVVLPFLSAKPADAGDAGEGGDDGHRAPSSPAGR
jgi:hypothetical protein